MPVNASTISKLIEKDEKTLNKLGSDGWELVSVIPVADNGTTDEGLAYFKHPIAE